MFRRVSGTGRRRQDTLLSTTVRVSVLTQRFDVHEVVKLVRGFSD